MKAVTIKELKQELNHLSPKEVMDLCLRLSRFKKENKELLTYLLFEASDEAHYIESVKHDTVRSQILDNNLRADGRVTTEVRPISIETNILPSAHASAPQPPCRG